VVLQLDLLLVSVGNERAAFCTDSAGFSPDIYIFTYFKVGSSCRNSTVPKFLLIQTSLIAMSISITPTVTLISSQCPE